MVQFNKILLNVHSGMEAVQFNCILLFMGTESTLIRPEEPITATS